MCVNLINEIKSQHLEKTNQNVIDVANRILEALNINNMPIDISKILTGLGFKIYVSDALKDNISGFIYVSPDLKNKFGTDKVIILNKNDSIGRQRFTLAHEFSHYIFDFNLDTMAYYTDAYDINRDKEESEIISSRFAAEFLIPKKAFLEKIKELDNKKISLYDKLNMLTEYFNVSLKSIRIRFIELQESIPDDLKLSYGIKNILMSDLNG